MGYKKVEWITKSGHLFDMARLSLAKGDRKLAAMLKDPGKLGDLLSDAATAAEVTADYLTDPEMAAHMRKSAGMLAELGDGISKGVATYNNFKNVVGIYEAWSDLDPHTVRSNPDAAVQQFGKMFNHVSALSHVLPYPLSRFAESFKHVGKMIAKVKDDMDPESANTPRGRMMRRVIDM